MNRIAKSVVFWMIISVPMLGVGQKAAFSANISDCSGAIQMETNRVLKPKIPIKFGEVDDLQAYSKHLKLPETNSLWFRFESPHTGWLKLTLQKVEIPIEYGVFILKKDQDCSSIHDGTAALSTHSFLDKESNSIAKDSVLYLKNQLVYFFINSTSPTNTEIAVEAFFEEQVSKEEFQLMKKIFDFRNAENDPPYSIMIRDIKTKLPVVASVIISDSRTHNALYSASDMVFTYSDNLRMTLNIDAEGYFFQDVEINTRRDKGNERFVYLEALEQNQLIELEGLVFEPHTDVLIPDALPKLKRLKDFMVINTEVNIEIQGHVHLDGKNTSKAKKLSKKRAKTVMKFLVENGINKKRISLMGYGNSKMRYPEAFSDAEKQANRRVEIKIK